MKSICIAVALIVLVGILACDSQTPLSSVSDAETEDLSSITIADETGTKTVNKDEMDSRIKDIWDNAVFTDTIYAGQYRIPWDADTKGMGCGVVQTVQSDDFQGKYCFPSFEGYRVIIYEDGSKSLAYMYIGRDVPGYGNYEP